MTRSNILVYVGIFAAVTAIGCASPEPADTGQIAAELNTADDVSLDPEDANWYGTFAPELANTLARIPPLDPETQLHVTEVKPNLFYVTEGIYQSAFLKTGQGVIVFDAPPSFAHKLPDAIKQSAPNEPIKYLVYSHGHSDHVGGASVFGRARGRAPKTSRWPARPSSDTPAWPDRTRATRPERSPAPPKPGRTLRRAQAPRFDPSVDRQTGLARE